MHRPTAATLLAAVLAAVPRAAGAPPSRPQHAPHEPAILTLVADIPLPGPPVRFDYQSLDPAVDRLYIAHMGAGNVVVFNVKSRQVEGTIDSLPGVTGVWAVPARGRVYASVTGLHHVAVIDARTWSVVARLGPIGFPDGIAYAPDQQKIYVSDERGSGELVIDARSDRILTTVALDGGEAGNTVYDPGSRCIVVAVQSRNALYVIDPVTERILGRFELPAAARPHGIALDVERRLAFVANQGNARLLVVDLRTMKVRAQLPVGGEPDVLAFDPVWRRLYVASESGTVTVFSETGDGLVRDGELRLPHAHSVAVDPRTHLVYFPLQDVRGRPLLRIMAAAPPVGSPP